MPTPEEREEQAHALALQNRLVNRMQDKMDTGIAEWEDAVALYMQASRDVSVAHARSLLRAERHKAVQDGAYLRAFTFDTLYHMTYVP